MKLCACHLAKDIYDGGLMGVLFWRSDGKIEIMLVWHFLINKKLRSYRFDRFNLLILINNIMILIK